MEGLLVLGPASSTAAKVLTGLLGPVCLQLAPLTALNRIATKYTWASAASMFDNSERQDTSSDHQTCCSPSSPGAQFRSQQTVAAWGYQNAESLLPRLALWKNSSMRVPSGAKLKQQYSTATGRGCGSGENSCACSQQAAASFVTAAAKADPAVKKVKVTVDGREVEVVEGKTVLQACRDIGIYVPSICYHPSLKPAGTCRLCLVDTGGWKLEPACAKVVSEGLKVNTHTAEVVDTLRSNLALMRLKHPNACMTCSVSGRCEFQDLLLRYDVDDPEILEKKHRVSEEVEEQGIAKQRDESSPSLSIDFDKCILCLRCVRACNELQGMNVFGSVGRGDHETVAALFNLPMSETACISCGACASVCPVGSIREKPHLQRVMELLAGRGDAPVNVTQRGLAAPAAEDSSPSARGPASRRGGFAPSPSSSAPTDDDSSPSTPKVAGSAAPVEELERDQRAAARGGKSRLLAPKKGAPNSRNQVLVAMTAPAVRVTISEAFGMAPGAISTGKLVSALRRLGFDYVFDTNYMADLTIMEEATELLERLKTGGPFPMFTSCCPGWINMVEKAYPEIIPHLSSCKSPQGMGGAIAKSYFAQVLNRDPKEITVVSMMPCVAKKDEASRKELFNTKADAPDVDLVLTTRELARLIEMARPKIHFPSLPEEKYDSPLGKSSGAALLFGVTGGVMEAALRTALAVTAPPGSPPMERLDLTEVRGLDGFRDATIDVHGTALNVAICNGGVNLRSFVDKMLAGELDKQYHFVEMMACKGGCIGGAGNPKDSVDEELLQHRSNATYQGDKAIPIRMSHENPDINKVYTDYLGKPNSHLAHELLHTHYKQRTITQTDPKFLQRQVQAAKKA